MKPALFDHVAPKTVDEAVAALAGTPGAMVIAGGQSLVPAMNFRFAAPDLLVDLSRIAGLDRITVADGAVVVGAMARHRAVELDPAVGSAQPLLPAALAHVAHVPIRNRGTVVGSLCHADAAAEMPLILVLTGGSVTLAGPAGRREVAAKDFFLFHLTTARSETEIAVEARFPVLAPGAGWSFHEIARRNGDYALAAVGAIVALDHAGRATTVRLAAGGIATKPVRLSEAEAILHGSALDAAAIEAAAASAVAAVTAPDDMHASTTARRRLTATLLKRTVAEARARAIAA